MKKLTLILIVLAFVGCKDADKESIAQAQLCINKVDEDDLTAIQNCLSKLGSIDTQEANIVRCSGQTLLGGLTSTKIVNAFSNSGEGASNNQAALMLTLAVSNQGSVDANKTLAKSTLETCTKSGVSGLIAVASFSNIGTSMTSVGTCTDPNNCTAADATTIVSSCGGGGCEPAEVGNTAITVSESYCTGDNANTPECQDIKTAIENGNGDPTTIGQYLMDNF